ncbi:Abi family protein [Hymenobacter sp. J193]|uniref:Abi family protein n=1 Tax=Hymenobacter sp. J193 TaxID=2898429 RepID=UPI0021515A53|nr:Abi family protein [Hymenobacter sp. J193]MCR5890306.1 Abi family protein [Hymenobacter sp. J193]MCR5890465.1 Abi family protein [Hymenobacter sp. J193]
MDYNKQAVSIIDQIALLRQRGLAIDDEVAAIRHLSNISYYRLAGYLLPFQSDKSLHIYKIGSRFETALELYRFDQKLRVLVFDIIERIEVSIRTQLIYTMSMNHTPWWFEDVTLFTSSDDHAEALASIDAELSRSHEEFILDHKARYGTDVRRPPAWKTLEIVTLGTLSRLYGNIRKELSGRDEIAAYFMVPPQKYLSGWLQSITQVRNVCAHHARLWNRTIAAAPKRIKRPRPELYYAPIPQLVQNKLYAALCCMNHLLFTISPEFGLGLRLQGLFAIHPNVDPSAMGFPVNWQQEPIWSIPPVIAQ